MSYQRKFDPQCLHNSISHLTRPQLKRGTESNPKLKKTNNWYRGVRPIGHIKTIGPIRIVNISETRVFELFYILRILFMCEPITCPPHCIFLRNSSGPRFRITRNGTWTRNRSHSEKMGLIELTAGHRSRIIYTFFKYGYRLLVILLTYLAGPSRRPHVAVNRRFYDV